MSLRYWNAPIRRSFHHISPLFQCVAAALGAFGFILDRVRKGRLAQSLKVERKPWAVISSRLMRRSIISSAMFDSGLPSRARRRRSRCHFLARGACRAGSQGLAAPAAPDARRAPSFSPQESSRPLLRDRTRQAVGDLCRVANRKPPFSIE
jgi:hypothetical protein